MVMLPDLKRLIRLQRLETAVSDAREAIAALPIRRAELDAHLEAREAELIDSERRLKEHRAAGQEAENVLAQTQARLSRFKEQLMAVKTNKEYHAMQTEIAAAEAEVGRLEDRLLEQMLDGDILAASVEDARSAVAAEQTTGAEKRAALEHEQQLLEQQIEQHAKDRAALAGDVPVATIALFESLARGRKGLAVSEARDGRCTTCQVRLRPQLYNHVRLNKTLIQCESCQRILYFRLEAGATTPS